MNQLDKIRCPKCRTNDQIDVEATCWVRLTSDGTDHDAAANRDHHLDQDSLTECGRCGFTAELWQFDAENEATLAYIQPPPDDETA